MSGSKTPPERMRILFGWLLPAVAGALFTLGLAPFDLWPAIPLSAALLLYHLKGTTPSSAFFTGWFYGIGLFVSGTSWVYVSINVYGRAAPPLALLLTGIFCVGLALLVGLQCWTYQRFFAPRGSVAMLVAFPAIWVLFEWLRSWLLTGFPWLYAGYSALDTPMAGWAPVIGVYGLSLWTVALGSAIAALLLSLSSHQHQPSWSRGTGLLSGWLAVVIILGAAGWGMGTVQWTRPAGEPLRVAAYQPNIPLEIKWDRRYRKAIFQQFEDASEDLYTTADLVLWPEGALPARRGHIESYLQRAADKARSGGATLITGIPSQSDLGLHNSIIALGKGAGEHHKQKLVPFGEYVPLEQWLRGLIAFFDLPMSSFVPGPAVSPQLKAGELRVAPFICYEVVYPDFVTRGARDADFLITVSNDSWFGDSIGPLQHLQMARFGALATGRDMVRGTNNGVSAIIEANGHIVAATPQFEEGVLRGDIVPRQGSTPIMRTGSGPILALCLLALAAIRRSNSQAAG